MPNPLYVPVSTPGAEQLQRTVNRDLKDQADEILARPGARNNLGMLDPAIVSRDEARIIAQAYPRLSQQQGRQPISPFQAVGNIGHVGPSVIEQFYPGESGQQFRATQQQVGPLEAARQFNAPSVQVPGSEQAQNFVRSGVKAMLTNVPGRDVAANVVAGLIPTHIGVKGAIENITNPVNYLPVVGFGKEIQAGVQAVSKGAVRTTENALVRVPVRPVQEAGLRLAGGRGVAGGAKKAGDYFVFKQTTSGTEFVPTKGTSITIPGFEDEDIFIHRPLGQTSGWVVSEGQTGMKLVPNAYSTRIQAIEAATAQLTKVGKERFDNFYVGETLKNPNFQSPRYKAVLEHTPPTKPVASITKTRRPAPEAIVPSRQEPVISGGDANVPPVSEAVTPPVAPERAVEPPVSAGPPPIKPPTGVGGDGEGMAGGDLVARLTQRIKEAKPLTSPTAKAISIERGKRATAIENALQSKSGEEARIAAFTAAKGEIATPEFARPSEAFSPQEAETLQDMIRTKFQNDAYMYLPTQTAFEKLFSGGRVPTMRELQMLEEVFGPDFAKAVLSRRSTSSKAWEILLETWNIPKALKASFDLSATLRQGAYLLMEGNPAKEAFIAQLKSLRSEAGFNAVNEAIAASPWYLRAVHSGLDMTLPRQARGLLGREEPFIGAQLAEKIPGIGIGVKLSNRAYTSFLNKIRMDTFARMAEKLDAMGATEADFKKLASDINIMTGRGELGKFSQASMILNLPFFSPRFAVSRFQLPMTLATRNPELAKMAAKDFIGYVGFMFTMLGLADAAGVGSVEWDVRSTDFGKLKVGNTTLDPFAGFQQPVRLIAQILTGKRKQRGNGRMERADPMERLGNFVETKLTPSASALLALRRGKVYGGAELTPATFMTSLLAPLPMVDVWQAVDDMGAVGGSLFGALGFLGAGVQTFQPNTVPTGPIRRTPTRIPRRVPSR